MADMSILSGVLSGVGPQQSVSSSSIQQKENFDVFALKNIKAID